jgi:hypothetical protein
MQEQRFSRPHKKHIPRRFSLLVHRRVQVLDYVGSSEDHRM